ncbi:MAG: V-type ATP synthase subunit D [Bacilli bacterium]|jgi:V/A-type H+-transporting ATPase subunit D|nr:V-type ATP synthase subunit D [Acholeplasmataceae bacterium]
MAIMNVNPTRMELSKLKQQLSIATRGHKLLKDKQDELVRQFMLIIKRNRALRMEVETKLKKIFSHFGNAQLQMSHQGIMEALMVPANAAHIGVGSKTIMNIKVPTVDYKDQEKVDLTYGFAYTPSELDQAVLALSKLLPKLIELAQIEKSCDMLAFEIEKTRRRVNAIEYIMIPDMQETIRYITQKLEDAERSNIIRLMKSKEIILSKQNNS